MIPGRLYRFKGAASGLNVPGNGTIRVENKDIVMYLGIVLPTSDNDVRIRVIYQDVVGYFTFLGAFSESAWFEEALSD